MTHTLSKYFYSFLIFFCFSASATAAGSPPRIDLTQDCKDGKKNCTPRTWYISQGFSENFFSAQIPKEWKEAKPFPLSVKKFLPLRGKFETFSLAHYFDMPDDLLNGNAQPALGVGSVGEVFEIYINGKLVVAEGASANGKITHHRTVSKRVYGINPAFLKASANQLLIKVQGDPDYILTGLGSSEGYYIGAYEDLNDLLRDRIGMVLNAIYLLVGLYHLLLFFKRRREVYNAYFGVYCITLAAYLFSRNPVFLEWPVDTMILNRIATVILLATGPVLLFFLNHLFSGKVKKPAYYSLIFCGLLVPPCIFASEEHVQAIYMRIWILVIMLFFIPYVFIEIIQAIRAGHPDAKHMLWGTLIYFGGILFDLVDALVFRWGILISRFGFSFYILGIAAILANRFLRLHNEVEELNQNLEKKVAKRTEELQQTLTEVHHLKTQQDGDYFLTSLLITPLSGKFSSTKNIACEVFTRQKKNFRFKRWQSEIGGDLSIVHSISLRGKAYTVFLNADAMGKSMQGAGGSIVCGTLFKTIVARTQSSPITSSQFPEQWLNACYEELQNVFVSFEGTMMVSAVIGLLEDESGLLYYINAEHPASVLYRDGNAEFLEAASEEFLRKIGIDVDVADFVVRTVKLQPGDILILGSDGRDDIALPSGASGRHINEDETLFLKVVQDAQGQLARISELLQSSGELIDDLSLIRIAFKENGAAEAADELAPALRSQGIDLLKAGDFVDAAEVLQEYVGRVPEDTEALFFVSFALKRLADRKKMRLAIAYGECCRLRAPKMIKNLNNLADCYRLLGNEERAQELLQRSQELEPENTRTQKLLAKMALSA